MIANSIFHSGYLFFKAVTLENILSLAIIVGGLIQCLIDHSEYFLKAILPAINTSKSRINMSLGAS